MPMRFAIDALNWMPPGVFMTDGETQLTRILKRPNSRAKALLKAITPPLAAE